MRGRRRRVPQALHDALVQAARRLLVHQVSESAGVRSAGVVGHAVEHGAGPGGCGGGVDALRLQPLLSAALLLVELPHEAGDGQQLLQLRLAADGDYVAKGLEQGLHQGVGGGHDGGTAVNCDGGEGDGAQDGGGGCGGAGVDEEGKGRG